MSLQQYKFAYGRSTKSLMLESDDIVKEIRTRSFEPVADVPAAILEAVNSPIGTEPLSRLIRPGDTVAFICNDSTRVANSFDFMPVLVSAMNRWGVPDENMKIVFALGSHRPMSREEMAREVGEEVAGRLKMFNSIATQSEDFEYFGETSRGTPVWIHKELCNVDHVILTGTIVDHYFSGYGGGRKAILPGCAALETIRLNHSHMLESAATLGVLDGNPCYEDQMEGVRLFARGRSLFLFNAILDAKHRFLKMFAGDFDLAHRKACEFVDEVYGSTIDKEADLVIASCGGYPKDINVYQMQKTMDNAMCAVREAGVVLLFAQCSEGSGSAKLEETFARLKTREAIRSELENNFQIGANKAFAITRPLSKARFILVTDLDPAMARMMHFEAATPDANRALELAHRLAGAHPSTILMPEGCLTVPRVLVSSRCDKPTQSSDPAAHPSTLPWHHAPTQKAHSGARFVPE